MLGANLELFLYGEVSVMFRKESLIGLPSTVRLRFGFGVPRPEK